ncbi:MAG TPA: VIT and VWA domain-containing protein [Candidatus Hydrogenedentes bacterium]|nr:VIT and VWA domain-containing protein [Candidatus Hydrogenedentota bacterium]
MNTIQQTTIGAAALLLLAACAVFAEAPTEGGLYAMDRDNRPLGACPLQHTNVAADIAGFIARVTVTQQFGNTFTTPIEAVYTFPLPENAAVDRMTMHIGDRVIKGIVKPRGEARRMYDAARQAGKTASLLDQDRPNIFTQSVANILPGDRIEIEISYVERLPFRDGQYTFAYPMVVGPRYIPGSSAPNSLEGRVAGTTQVPDASRITPPVTPEGTRAGHDISVKVNIDAGLPIQDVQSELHEVDIERPAPQQAVVQLRARKDIPNRDFILRYAVSAPDVRDAVLAHGGANGGFFMLFLQPPERVAPEQATPKEMIFVIDCSGSMSGFPIEKAKETMKRCIEQMNPHDTFNLISFAGGTGYCFPNVVPNTDGNRAAALRYLERLQGGGGTEMMPAILAALGGPRDPERLRTVCFMTDGFIGNDMEILGAIKDNANQARVFAFGIGNGVNRFLIEGMARTGRGAAEIVTLESKSDEAVRRFHERIHSPVLTDITVNLNGAPLYDIHPSPDAIPDLFAAEPLVLCGRYDGPAHGTVVLRGRTSAGPFERAISLELPREAPEHDMLAPLWARAHVDALMNDDWRGMQQGRPRPDIEQAITDLGVTFCIMTPFTSFVAVEEKIVNQGGQMQRVDVPVEMTDGVSYEGVFGERDARACGKGFGYAPRAAYAPAKNGIDSEAVCEALPGSVPAMTIGCRVNRQAARQETAAAGTASYTHPKLDSALTSLESKVVNGSYRQGAVKVEYGYVNVVIRVSDLTPENVAKLEQLGVRVVSQTVSGKRILARVRIQDLLAVCNLDFVTRVEPPAT